MQTGFAASSVPDKAAMLERAVLVYGPRKAGTTLLQRLIDGSNLYVYPTELKVKFYASAPWTNRNELVDHFSTVNLVLKRQFENFRSDSYKEMVGQRLPAVRSLRDLILADVSAAIESSPPGEWIGWAAKDVGGDFRTVFRDWKKNFPDSQFVVIVRNPFFVSRSVFRDRRKNNRVLGWRELWKEVVDPWRVLGAISTVARRKDVHLVHYEDVIADPETQMRGIASFLGIEFVSALTYPTLFGQPIVVKTASRNDQSVFRERQAYWRGLTAREFLFLTAVGGLLFVKNLFQKRIIVSKGEIRLRGHHRQAHRLLAKGRFDSEGGVPQESGRQGGQG